MGRSGSQPPARATLLDESRRAQAHQRRVHRRLGEPRSSRHGGRRHRGDDRHGVEHLTVGLRQPIGRTFRTAQDPQTRARGIGLGVVLGAVLWGLAVAVALAFWR